MKTRFLFASCGLLACCCLALVGCGLGASEAKGTGKVVYRGTAVTEGDINFLSKEKGVGAVTKIESSGVFTLPPGLQPGSYAVYVTPPVPTPPPPGTHLPPPAPSPIPLKARDPATSGVVVALQGGSNEVVVELRD